MVTARGMDTARRELRRMSSVSRAELDRGIQLAGEDFRDFTKRMPPVSARTTGYNARGMPKDLGDLARSIKKRRIQMLAAGVFTDAKHAVPVHEGVRPFTLNRSVYIRGVGWRFIGVHPGMPRRPFFDWSLEMGALDRIDKIMVETLTRIAP